MTERRGEAGSGRTITRNMAWNWAGMAASMAAGFVVAPFLVHRLGETTYGLWILIASFTSYFGLLDLGVRGSVGRNIAFRRARGDQEGVNALLSTALAVLSAAGLVALAGTIGAAVALPHLFEIPADQVADARLALLLVGINLALWLPLNVFDAALWADQRFDLLNAIDITWVLLRTAATFALVGAGHDLVALGFINLFAMAGGQAVKGIVAFRSDPALRAGPDYVRMEAARGLFGYGLWYFLLSASRTIAAQAGPFLIGIRLGVALVTPYNIALRLVGYGSALLMAGTGVLTPVATALHAHENHDRQRWLFLEGGRYCAALAFFLVSSYLLLGRPLIVLWMGPEYASSASLLAILALGEALPMSQWVTQSTILAMGRHRVQACVNLAEVALAIALAAALSRPYGLMGVCVAFAVSAALCRGVVQMAYGCRVAGVPLRRYVHHALLMPLAAVVPPAAVLGGLVAWRPPAGAGGLLLYGAAYALSSLATAAAVLIGSADLRLIGTGLARRYSGERARTDSSGGPTSPTSPGVENRRGAVLIPARGLES